ncbi:MAG: CPBP family glutamic-type intramembrane protease [Methanobacteriaceae archaeon]
MPPKEEEISEKDMFKFERKGLDFPFYNNNPHLTTKKWIIMVIGLILFQLLAFLPADLIPIDSTVTGALYFLILVISFGLASDWNFNLIVKKFKKWDIFIILGLLILGYIYSMGVAILLHQIGIFTNPNPAIESLHSLAFWIGFPLQIFAEELLKIMTFLIVLGVIYNLSSKRKFSILIATLISIIIFGLLHINAYGNIVSILLIQGLGAIFMMFAYFKTKNILVSYVIHLLTDAIIFVILI